MQKIFGLLMLVFLLALSFDANAQQNMNPRDINISELSEGQIQQIYDQMVGRGLSQQQAEAMALQRGFTQGQVQELRQRFQQLQLGSGASGASSSSSRESNNIFDFENDSSIFMMFSEKKEIEPTAEEKRLFGFNIFNSAKLTFEPTENIPVPGSYAIGNGDEIMIDVWGASEQSYFLMVERNGNIIIPNAGPVAVAGLTLEKARKKIFDKLSLIYRDLKADKPNTFANIYMGYLHPIKVHVVGEVFAPGSYTLPGTATAFNALYLSGGPNINGSFRDIRVIRDGDVMDTLDVYSYLIDGNIDENVSLRDGDVIMVPTYINRVRIGGQFKKPGIFETKDGENVADVVRFAGGFTEKAYTHRLELYRTDSRQTVFKDVSMEQYNDETIINGDSIFAGEIIKRIENRVTIDGAIRRPGNYELTPDMTLSQLLEKAEGLREDAFLERGMILRLDKNLQLEAMSFDVARLNNGSYDTPLKREDLVRIYSIDSLRQHRTVSIKGEVRNPGMFNYRDGITLADLITMADGFRETASSSYIEIARRLTHEEASEYQKRTGHLFQFTISRNLALDQADSSFELKPYDQVYVRKAPGFTEAGSVQVQGEVLYVGQYSLNNREERLSSIIERAGGLTTDAYTRGAMLTRMSELDTKEKRIRQQLEERDETLSFDDMEFEVLAIDLEAAMENPGSRDDVFLRNGDELFIPRELQTVKVGGEVLNPISTSFIEGKGLRYYVDQSGGFSNQAKQGKAYVVYPNGKAAATQKILFLNNYPKILPGCEIVIPEKPERNTLPPTAWVSIGSTAASMALTVVTIINTLK